MSSELPDLKYWIAFSQILSLGPIRFRKLYTHFPSLEEAWDAGYQALIQSGLEESIVQEIIDLRKNIDPDYESARLAKSQVKTITIKESGYPKLLKEIYNPPPILYYLGNLEAASNFSLAVVGTRKFSPYGQQVVAEIVSALAEKQITIVSGLALGIDSLAHQAVLNMDGKTIGVLGCGLDNIYPMSNTQLAQDIVKKNGALISEYPLGTPALKHHFPYRNRIISGLSLGVLIIEAPESSGALITAKYALEQNRDVFAVPGDINRINSVGTNNLIKMGAKLVTEANDILDALNLEQAADYIKTKKIIPQTPEEKTLLEFLSRQPIHIDKLIELSGLQPSQINSTLLMMEMKGMIRNLGGQNYVVSH